MYAGYETRIQMCSEAPKCLSLAPHVISRFRFRQAYLEFRKRDGNLASKTQTKYCVKSSNLLCRSNLA